MTYEVSETVEAVVFFADGEISREMLYPEFEAILDGFIPVPDFKSSSVKAVYITVNSEFYITSAVFFLLDFNDRGMADHRWNVPLQQLAEVSGRGPDMGAGPIRLACYSQCAIAWQQKKLWDPVMDTKNNSFAIMKKSIKNNKLGIIFRKPPTPSGAVATSGEINLSVQQKMHEHYSQELRDQVASVLKEQRLHIATLHSRQQEAIHELQQEHQLRLQAYQEKLQLLEADNHELETRNRVLRDEMEVQAAKIEGMREYYTHKLKAAESDENKQLLALQENFAVELELKVQAATSSLREMLDMRDVELFYRHQNEAALKEEIANIKRDYQGLLNNSGDQLLPRLSRAGVNFVVYHPGVGQLTIAQDDLIKYLDNPAAYVAKHAGVGESLYSKWFAHYQNPVCGECDFTGKPCGKPLVRIGSPIEFHEGESDRCEQHQRVSYRLAADRR